MSVSLSASLAVSPVFSRINLKRKSQHQSSCMIASCARQPEIQIKMLKMQEENKAAFLYLPLLFAVFSILQYINHVEKPLVQCTSRRFRMTSPLHLCCLLSPVSAHQLEHSSQY